MFMNRIIIAFVAVASLGLASCSFNKAGANSDSSNPLDLFGNFIMASDHYVSRNVPLEDFKSIETYGSFNVEYRHGNQSRAELYMPDNVIKYLDIEVEAGKLKLGIKNNTIVKWRNDNKSKIIVYAPSVNELSIQGSGSLVSKEPLQGKRVSLSLSGSGDLLVESLKASSANVEIEGSGDVSVLSIDVDEDAELSMTGSGDLNVKSLNANNAIMNLTGSGDFRVVTLSAKALSASLTGSGEMWLRGTADKVSYALDGSGELKAGRLKVRDMDARVSGSGEITCYATGKTNFKASMLSSIHNLAR